jgi:hypothetical protein
MYLTPTEIPPVAAIQSGFPQLLCTPYHCGGLPFEPGKSAGNQANEPENNPGNTREERENKPSDPGKNREFPGFNPGTKLTPKPKPLASPKPYEIRD